MSPSTSSGTDGGRADPPADGTEDSAWDSPAVNDPASYEQARDELAEVVATLEAGGLSLDDSLALWERGERLAAVCHRFLDGARERVDAALARTEDKA